MQSKSSNSRGFGHVFAILIILVMVTIAGVGVYVFTRNDNKKHDSASNSNGGSNTTANPDPYNGWKTANLASPKLSFRYPADWTLAATPDGKNVEVKSPTDNGHYFSVSLIAGKSHDVNVNFLGTAAGTKLLDLTVDGKTLYCVAQTASTDDMVVGLGLAITAGGAKTSFGIVDPQNVNNLTMYASLVPMTSGPTYSMKTYTAHASYQDVLKIFQSLSGDLPN